MRDVNESLRPGKQLPQENSCGACITETVL